jgi:tyrosyl-tRNA synthetase
VDGSGKKMGKTTGNMLSFQDTANEMFKKIMTWGDDSLLLSFELLTDVDLNEVRARLDGDENPRDIKFDLALAIVSKFYGEEEAKKGKESWINDVQKDNKPSEMPEIDLLENFIDTLSAGSGESKGQVKRLLKEGAIKVNGEKISDIDFVLKNGDEIQIGKKRWFMVK